MQQVAASLVEIRLKDLLISEEILYEPDRNKPKYTEDSEIINLFDVQEEPFGTYGDFIIRFVLDHKKLQRECIPLSRVVAVMTEQFGKCLHLQFSHERAPIGAILRVRPLLETSVTNKNARKTTPTGNEDISMCQHWVCSIPGNEKVMHNFFVLADRLPSPSHGEGAD